MVEVALKTLFSSLDRYLIRNNKCFLLDASKKDESDESNTSDFDPRSFNDRLTSQYYETLFKNVSETYALKE